MQYLRTLQVAPDQILHFGFETSIVEQPHVGHPSCAAQDQTEIGLTDNPLAFRLQSAYSWHERGFHARVGQQNPNYAPRPDVGIRWLINSYLTSQRVDLRPS